MTHYVFKPLTVVDNMHELIMNKPLEHVRRRIRNFERYHFGLGYSIAPLGGWFGSNFLDTPIFPNAWTNANVRIESMWPSYKVQFTPEVIGKSFKELGSRIPYIALMMSKYEKALFPIKHLLEHREWERMSAKATNELKNAMQLVVNKIYVGAVTDGDYDTLAQTVQRLFPNDLRLDAYRKFMDAYPGAETHKLQDFLLKEAGEPPSKLRAWKPPTKKSKWKLYVWLTTSFVSGWFLPQHFQAVVDYFRGVKPKKPTSVVVKAGKVAAWVMFYAVSTYGMSDLDPKKIASFAVGLTLSIITGAMGDRKTQQEKQNMAQTSAKNGLLQLAASIMFWNW